MNNLLPGLRKYSERIFPKQQKMFEALSQGQKPHTLMITCSDSRINPNLLTQTNPGEMFIVRNAGNIVPPYGSSKGGEEAAIEFAVEGLGVSNIVVCGHSKCGAMAALLNQATLDSLPAVKNWLKHAQTTKRRAEAIYDNLDLKCLVEENVLAQADNLKTHPSVSAALRANRVQIFGWVYNFESGSVVIYDPRLKKFLPSTEVREQAQADVSQFAL